MLSWASLAAAQVPDVDLDTELVHTSVDAPDTSWTDAPAAPAAPTAFVRASSWYAHRPLVYTTPDGAEVAVVASVVRTDVAGGWTSGRWRGAVVLPVAWTAGSEVRDGGGTGLGDLALDGRVGLLEGPVAVAAAARLQVPTSGLELPLSSPGPVVELTAVAGAEVGPVTLLGNLGPRLAPREVLGDATLNDALAWRAAAVLPAGGSAVAAELAGRLGFGTFAAASPVEVLLGGRTPLGGGANLRGGVSGGLGGAVGVPAFRLVVGVDYAGSTRREARPEPVAAVGDDGDPVAEGDACPDQAEDVDGRDDADGCPDPDDDGDGVVDALDACRGEVEDVDGWRDDDGCPDPKTRVGVRLVSPDGGVWAGAEVNVVCGTTTRTISADQAIDVEPGTCTFGGGAHDGPVRAFSRTVEVAPGRPVDLVLTAEGAAARPVTVTVTAAGGGAVEQAAWSFDGGRAMRVSEAATARVTPGRHEVRVFAQGYREQVTSLEVPATGDAAPLVVALEPLPAWLARGRLWVQRPVTFVPGTNDLDEAAAATLAAVAQELAAHPEVALRIEVHVPPGPASQLAADERGLHVREALVAQGVAAARLTVAGLGASRPLPGADERVEWWVVGD